MPQCVFKAVTAGDHKLLSALVALAASDSRHQQVLYVLRRTGCLVELHQTISTQARCADWAQDQACLVQQGVTARPS